MISVQSVHVQSKHVLNVSPQLYIPYSYYQLLARKLQFLHDFYKCCNIESEPKGPISIVNFNLQKGQLKDTKGHDWPAGHVVATYAIGHRQAA